MVLAMTSIAHPRRVDESDYLDWIINAAELRESFSFSRKHVEQALRHIPAGRDAEALASDLSRYAALVRLVGAVIAEAKTVYPDVHVDERTSDRLLDALPLGACEGDAWQRIEGMVADVRRVRAAVTAAVGPSRYSAYRAQGALVAVA